MSWFDDGGEASRRCDEWRMRGSGNNGRGFYMGDFI